jgi:hypothetical protein
MGLLGVGLAILGSVLGIAGGGYQLATTGGQTPLFLISELKVDNSWSVQIFNPTSSEWVFSAVAECLSR